MLVQLCCPVSVVVAASLALFGNIVASRACTLSMEKAGTDGTTTLVGIVLCLKSLNSPKSSSSSSFSASCASHPGVSC
uniref:Putative secreted protein n=1 Tax=Anopheles marajoara TaxID=58244 RepID=A0A2M4CCD5_9DIPT